MSDWDSEDEAAVVLFLGLGTAVLSIVATVSIEMALLFSFALVMVGFGGVIFNGR